MKNPGTVCPQERTSALDIDESARRWMIKYARKNFWRVAAWYELDDLIQDGLMCWWHVRRRYADIAEMRHIMSLFQRTYINHVHQMANKRSAGHWFSHACGEEIAVTEECVEDVSIAGGGHVDPAADEAILISEAPVDVRKLIVEIVQHPELTGSPCRRRMSGSPRRPRMISGSAGPTRMTRRETTNEWLCRIAGLDPTQFDLRSRLLAHLRPGEELAL